MKYIMSLHMTLLEISHQLHDDFKIFLCVVAHKAEKRLKCPVRGGSGMKGGHTQTANQSIGSSADTRQTMA